VRTLPPTTLCLTVYPLRPSLAIQEPPSSQFQEPYKKGCSLPVYYYDLSSPTPFSSTLSFSSRASLLLLAYDSPPPNTTTILLIRPLLLLFLLAKTLTQLLPTTTSDSPLSTRNAGRSIANNIQVERHHEKTHKKKWYHIKLLFQKLFSHNNMPLLFLPLLHHPPTMPPSFSSSSFFLAVVALLSPSTESQRSWFQAF